MATKRTSKKATAKAPTGAKRSSAKKSPKTVTKEVWENFPKDDPRQIATMINIMYGDAGPIMRPGDEAWDVTDIRRQCGIPSLDLMCGGGFPAGKVCQIDGPESTGKNFLLYRYFARAQQVYGNKAVLAMACFESFVDKHFAQLCGCKIAMSAYDIKVTQRARRLAGLPPLTDEEIEEAMNVEGVGEFFIFSGPSEAVLNGTIKAIASNAFQIIGIDSWDSMLTAQEESKELGEFAQVASAASLQTQWAKKVQKAFDAIYRCPYCGNAPLTKKVINAATKNYKYECGGCGWKGIDPHTEVNETTVIAIKQSRAKLQMSGQKVMGRPYDSKGAYSLQHLNTIRISLHQGSYVRASNVKIGKEVNWEITKAKCSAREGATGSYTLFFDPLQVDVQADMLAQCVKHGVIETREGGWYDFPEVDIDSVRGKDSVLMLLEQEPDLMLLLNELLLIKSGLPHVRFDSETSFDD